MKHTDSKSLSAKGTKAQKRQDCYLGLVGGQLDEPTSHEGDRIPHGSSRQVCKGRQGTKEGSPKGEYPKGQ